MVWLSEIEWVVVQLGKHSFTSLWENSPWCYWIDNADWIIKPTNQEYLLLELLKFGWYRIGLEPNSNSTKSYWKWHEQSIQQ